MSRAAPMPPTLPGSRGFRSAEMLYIQERIELRMEKRNHWDKEEIIRPAKLLWRSTRPHKVTPKKINETNLLFYHSGRVVGSFDGAITTLVSHQARRACASHTTLRGYLKASGLPAPEGKAFLASQAANALEYRRQLAGPVAVGPVSWKADPGVVTRAYTDDQFSQAWDAAAKECAALPDLHRQILVDKYYQGLDLRLYVVGEEISAAVVRLPFYAIGDGRSTVSELHHGLAEVFKDDPYLTAPSATAAKAVLERRSLGLTHVPRAGEVVPLSETASAAPGRAITVDVRSALHPGLKRLAVDAMWAFPGLSAAGVDLRVTGVEDPEGAVVIAVDPATDIREFRYPTYGQYRRVSMDIISQMVRQSRR